MAKKGTKYKSYSIELKKQILKEYFNGEGGWKALGKKYGIPYQTIHNWIIKVKKNIDISIDGRGRGPKGKGRHKEKILH